MHAIRDMGFRGMSVISGSPLQILLAEADPPSQKVFRVILRKQGHCADVVDNGLEALQALGLKQYDILFLNIMMPEMDGFTVTHEIRKCSLALRQPKIIAVTTYAFPDSRQKCLEAGMDDYIAKPVRIEDLARVLDKYRQMSLKNKCKF
jgi:CheY-like chemotaxis protein